MTAKVKRIAPVAPALAERDVRASALDRIKRVARQPDHVQVPMSQSGACSRAQTQVEGLCLHPGVFLAAAWYETRGHDASRLFRKFYCIFKVFWVKPVMLYSKVYLYRITVFPLALARALGLERARHACWCGCGFLVVFIAKIYSKILFWSKFLVQNKAEFMSKHKQSISG